eukprot:CAMPEP_0113699958 /NCGR_PEP_ID=MMETSP0038_2-20120614/23653_1 /TAXON_ID=2898 /ORGANISM="Cryptomonas paramecium" /LENGTH=213 /DNA_ID=CAMNT_0000623487 /DNA_START=95 /DNA_END=736 /DNA_ORIENTATION=+ /assembly_acc=CAM_ASM_000170
MSKKTTSMVESRTSPKQEVNPAAVCATRDRADECAMEDVLASEVDDSGIDLEEVFPRLNSGQNSASGSDDSHYEAHSIDWYKKLDVHWCGFLRKRDRNQLNPVSVWRRRWFELRQPILRPHSTYPVLAYLSKCMKKEKILRVKDVKHSVEGQLFTLTLDYVECASDEDVDSCRCQQMTVCVPEEAKSSHFHTKLLMMLEAGRRFRLDLQCFDA